MKEYFRDQFIRRQNNCESRLPDHEVIQYVKIFSLVQTHLPLGLKKIKLFTLFTRVLQIL